MSLGQANNALVTAVGCKLVRQAASDCRLEQIQLNPSFTLVLCVSGYEKARERKTPNLNHHCFKEKGLANSQLDFVE